ncbi:DNA mismatch repair protein msh6 [Desmophyllum pertusum]|uniref:DNA mismatch repair protein msh6 n=1 Tax=Desmophyllum pertusum TaxID=174260 RepID=A0A9X0CN00_9CNID|nr:DNA mismatch repair protein msh6 [Desmophyllum pertusum]
MFLNHELMSSMKEYLTQGGITILEASKTLKVLAEQEYFKEDKKQHRKSSQEMADVLKKLTDGGLTPGEDSELALSALVLLLEYHASRQPLLTGTEQRFGKRKTAQILDNITLTNLDIIPRGPDTDQRELAGKIGSMLYAIWQTVIQTVACAPLLIHFNQRQVEFCRRFNG